MFIELVDALRCPNAHQDTWLVAAVAEFRGRHIARGSLGCPICRAQFPVANGEADFTTRGHLPSASGVAGRPGEDDVLRARALLNLDEPGGVVVLVGRGAKLGSALEDEGHATVLLVNPVGARLGPGVSTLWVDDRLPVAPDSVRGALLGDDDVGPTFVASVVQALRPRARLVAPVSIRLPEGMHELARDERQWVAEKVAGRVSPPVRLQRA